MRRFAMAAVLLAASLSGPANAYEYPLLFTPLPDARGLVVAGYLFKGASVSGNCSYYTVTNGSGRGGHGYTTYFNQTCAWDLHGNLKSITSGAPTIPAPLSSVNGLTIYARDAAGDTTGADTAIFQAGFVNVRSAQYAWTTPSGGYLFLAGQVKTDITLTLQSIGDLPLAVSKISPAAALGKAKVKSSTCAPAGGVAPGASCTIVVTYDPTAIPGGDDPYTAYDTLTVKIISNSGQAPIFTESIEVPISPAG